MSNELIAETLEALRKPKLDRYVPLNRRLEALEYLLSQCTEVAIATSIDVCRDQKDNHLLALAIDGKADWLVTGDKDLFVLDRDFEFRILSPKEFIELLSRS